MLERIEDGYFEIDLSRKGRYEYVNDAFCRTTGYSRDAIVHHGRLDAGIQMISKPFAYDELAAKIRAVLDGN